MRASPSINGILRRFLLDTPPAEWTPNGQADADGAINAMKELWHYFEGMRAVNDRTSVC